MKTALLSTFAAFGILFATSVASADSLSDCGNIDVEANAQCEVMAEGGCAVDQCSPVSCSASLYAGCKGECKATLPSCEVDCNVDCKAECSASANFDCSANCTGRCKADCSGDCEAECKDSTCKAKCEGTCEASCKGDCSAKCDVDASASCDAKCAGSCSGSCTTKANLSCQMDCRAKGEVDCTGGCEIACSKPNAALFCDSQYIDHGGNLDSCVGAIEAFIEANVEFDAKADGSAACNNGTCKAEGSAEASASCAMAKRPNPSSFFGLGLLGAVTTGLVLRRRQRRG